ncbi:Glycosyltransferase, GT2 family [Pedobacter westerhofensis]|uniref:Glycosyltransferase, GT2 family n=1 Tax=Pedobacter westerhofensis TaxID=425512 RepID=A0A521F829_9SPHI|nr:glycosyltransferase [Pedobacter westerhofensis]SMO91771.1 Glycosyltransferase, GT2 family [Pedobacter westerhofensis]
MKRSISVIIPNYNGRELLALYLPSVINALTIADIPYELIVVDDCSKDDSVKFIQTAYPEVILIANRKNSGFSFTCNQGIKIAKMELTLLLNSDVQLSPDYFTAQWKYFDHNDTFGVMGRIMSRDGRRIEDAARILFYKGCRLKANQFYYSNDKDARSYTAYLSGANALVNTRKLKELEGFDEIFSPFTSEDSDLSTRAWLLGWKCYYEHSSVCYHQVSGSIRKNMNTNFVKTIYFRNRFIFHRIHLTGFRAAALPLYIVLAELLTKLLTGKIWILDSFNEYKKTEANIKISVDKLNALKIRHSSTMNIEDIIQKINHSIDGKPIIRL